MVIMVQNCGALNMMGPILQKKINNKNNKVTEQSAGTSFAL